MTGYPSLRIRRIDLVCEGTLYSCHPLRCKIVYNPIKIGGIPTANEIMMPMRVPRSRLFHPLAAEFVVDAPPVLVGTLLVGTLLVGTLLVGTLLVGTLLVGTLLVEGTAGAAVDAPAVATRPTAIVVVDVGRLGSVSSASPSQVSITAAMAPLYAA